MNSFNSIIGNEHIIKSLITSIKGDNVSHAYMFVSQDKILSFEIANVFAKAIMCSDFHDDVCNECLSCKTFESDNNPDVTLIDLDEGKDIIGVDSIKNMVAGTKLRPFSSKNKVYIINNADCMTEGAQNALLKTIEEPNSYVKLILVVGNMKNVLPTILSRSIKIKLAPFKKSEMKEYCLLKYKKIDETKIDYYINYAQGSAMELDNIINNKSFIKIREEVIALSSKICSNDILDMLEVKNYLIKSKGNLDTVLDILEIWYRDLLFMKEDITDRTINSDQMETLEFQALKYKSEKIQNIIKNITKLRKDNKSYANIKIATEYFLIKCSEV